MTKTEIERRYGVRIDRGRNGVYYVHRSKVMVIMSRDYPNLDALARALERG